MAARYRQQQWLIGPELYPFYLYFLQMIGAIVAAVVSVSALAKGIVHQGQPGPMIVDLFGSLWWSLAGTVGSVTIVFALIERYGGVGAHFRNWAPDELPELPDLIGQPRKRWEAGFGAAMGVLVLLWWAGAVRLPVPWNNASFRLEPAPIWMQLYWPIFALIAARLAHDALYWLRPRARWLIGLLSIASAVGGVIVAGLVYRSGQWATVVPLAMGAEDAAKLQDSITLSLRIGIFAVAMVLALQCLSELWRFARAPRA